MDRSLSPNGAILDWIFKADLDRADADEYNPHALESADGSHAVNDFTPQTFVSWQKRTRNRSSPKSPKKIVSAVHAARHDAPRHSTPRRFAHKKAESHSSSVSAIRHQTPGTEHNTRHGSSSNTSPERFDPYAKKPRRKTKTDRYERKLRKVAKRIVDASKPRKREKGQRGRQRTTATQLHGFSAIAPRHHRLTLQARTTGLFKKGRGSFPSSGQCLPDLAFHEVEFLNRSRPRAQAVEEDSREASPSSNIGRKPALPTAKLPRSFIEPTTEDVKETFDFRRDTTDIGICSERKWHVNAHCPSDTKPLATNEAARRKSRRPDYQLDGTLHRAGSANSLTSSDFSKTGRGRAVLDEASDYAPVREDRHRTRNRSKAEVQTMHWTDIDRWSRKRRQCEPNTLAVRCGKAGDFEGHPSERYRPFPAEQPFEHLLVPAPHGVLFTEKSPSRESSKHLVADADVVLERQGVGAWQRQADLDEFEELCMFAGFGATAKSAGIDRQNSHDLKVTRAGIGAVARPASSSIHSHDRTSYDHVGRWAEHELERLGQGDFPRPRPSEHRRPSQSHFQCPD